MLNTQQVQESDRFVQFFYEQLERCPSNFNGHDILEFGEKYRRMQMIGISIFPEEQVNEALDEAQRTAAESSGIDKLGIERLVTRVPVVFYFPKQEEDLSRVVAFDTLTCPADGITRQGFIAERKLELGLCPDVLQSFKWCHGSMGGIKAGDWGYKNPIETSNISEYIAEQLGEDVQTAFSGLAYRGRDADRRERLLLFIDTSNATKVIENNNRLTQNCVQVAERYGADGIFTLYAPEYLETGWFFETRLDVDDSKHTDLTITDLGAALDTIRQQYTENTFYRQLIQHFDNQGTLTAGDAGQGVRDFLRARIEYTMQQRAYELLETEINRASGR